jgi:hypothetical protein
MGWYLGPWVRLSPDRSRKFGIVISQETPIDASRVFRQYLFAELGYANAAWSRAFQRERLATHSPIEMLLKNFERGGQNSQRRLRETPSPGDCRVARRMRTQPRVKHATHTWRCGGTFSDRANLLWS